MNDQYNKNIFNSNNSNNNNVFNTTNNTYNNNNNSIFKSQIQQGFNIKGFKYTSISYS